ncbi:MAG: NAD(P)H-hydrate dehydratase [Sphingobacteriaceae bacterium]|nr:NAD(P)H-hydrate dehydratase [Cytophagaceae bacterium]
MKLFTAAQIRDWDALTIKAEPVSSLDLMERAASALTDWLLQQYREGRTELFPRPALTVCFCGMGNNGGDGLVVARLLHQAGWPVQVVVVRHSEKASADFKANLDRFESLGDVHWIEKAAPVFPKIPPDSLVLDALLGTGLSRPASGILAETIGKINQSNATVVAVDIASGLFAEAPNGPDDPIVRPAYTVSFQRPKLAFLQPKLAEFVGEWRVLDIGLSDEFDQKTQTPFFLTDEAEIRRIQQPRSRFSHKGSYGHALLLAGSFGKIGAALLAARACLRSGVGLLTVQVPGCGYSILQTAVPEAMCLTDPDERTHTTVPDLAPYQSVGVGPGLGKDEKTAAFLEELLEKAGKAKVPLVLDADALNLLSEDKTLLKKLPPDSLLTPHPKEFERLAGTWANDYEKLELLRDFCQKYRCVVTLKGAYTAVGIPTGVSTRGEVHFNTTGNPGMATGGTGDVLTGVLTALRAQGYGAAEAAKFGVFQHGLAGDRVVAKRGFSTLVAGELVEQLGW